MAGVLDAMLSPEHRPRCSVFFITDAASSDPSTIALIRLLRSPGGVGVFTTTADVLHGNVTLRQLPQWISQARKLRQVSWCVTVVVVSDDLTFLATFAQWSLKGRLLVWSTRLLVLTRLPLHHLHILHTLLSNTNSMLIIYEESLDSVRCGVYLQVPYSPLGAQAVKVASWTPQRGLALTSSLPLFPDKFSKFIQRPTLTLAAEINALITVVNPKEDEAGEKVMLQFAGPAADLVSYLAKGLNFSYKYMRPPDGSSGSKREDGSWSGMVGMVIRQEIDVAVGPFGVSAVRAEVVDFTVPILTDYGRILGARGRPEVDPWGFLFPLEPLVWAAILGALLVLPLTTLLMASCFSPNTHGHNYIVPPTSAFLRILLYQCISVEHSCSAHVTLKNKHFFIVGEVVGVVLTTGFKGFTVYVPTFSDFHFRDDLLKFGFTIVVACGSDLQKDSSTQVTAVTFRICLSVKIKKCKMGKWSKYQEAFQRSWLKDPVFEKWLAEVKEDGNKAYCKVCRTEIRAHRSDLKKHSETLKHRQNISEAHPFVTWTAVIKIGCSENGYSDIGGYGARIKRSKQDIITPVDWWWERVVLTVWGLVTVVLTQSYAGNLMALLAVRHIPQPYQSLRDVLDDRSVITVWEQGSSNVQFVREAEFGIYREIAGLKEKGRLIYKPRPKFTEIIDTLVRRGDHILMDIDFSLKIYMSEDFTESGQCSFYKSKEEFMPLMFALVTEKGSPLVSPLNDRILGMTEAGLFKYWMRAAQPNSTVCSQAPTTITVQESLSLNNVMGMFVLLAGGHSISVLVLCLELVAGSTQH
ncbi:uncharacterized protein [Procambarus clarkii]|uniref:uncharacterized protein n=1 Tax=Procambarus clarkii TaxID=6728 RepID=UPI003744952C